MIPIIKRQHVLLQIPLNSLCFDFTHNRIPVRQCIFFYVAEDAYSAHERLLGGPAYLNK